MRQPGWKERRTPSTGRRPEVRTLLITSIIFTGSTLVGCSSSGSLTAAEQAEAQLLVVERSAAAMIDLSDEDRDCVVDDISSSDLEGLRGDDVSAVADAVVSCVGDELIGASVLRSQTGEISPESLDCAVGELDRRFVVDLVAGAMNGSQPLVQAEIEVARVLAICLELDELL